MKTFSGLLTLLSLIMVTASATKAEVSGHHAHPTLLRKSPTAANKNMLITTKALSNIADLKESDGTMHGRELQNQDCKFPDECLLNAPLTCLDCLSSYYYPLRGASCQEFEDTMCNAITTSCNCAPCEQDLETYFGCLHCPDLDCNLAPSGPCDPEFEAIVECVVEAPPSCGTCLDDALATWLESTGDTYTCEGFQSGMCPSIASLCDCDPCRHKAEAYYECLVFEDSEGICDSFDCDIRDEPSTSLPVPATAAPEPTPGPTVPEQPPTTQSTPVPNPVPTAWPTPEPTPFPTPDSTPESTIQTSPESTQGPTPAPTPNLFPQPTSERTETPPPDSGCAPKGIPSTLVSILGIMILAL